MFFWVIFFLFNTLNVHGQDATTQNETIEQTQPNQTMLPEPIAQPSVCIAAIFDVIELKMFRTKTVSVPLRTSIRYNTLVLHPTSCSVQKYAGDHQNTTILMNVGVLPHRVMVESPLAHQIPPSTVFHGLMSTISPTFADENYAIIPKGCQTIPCPAG